MAPPQCKQTIKKPANTPSPSPAAADKKSMIINSGREVIEAQCQSSISRENNPKGFSNALQLEMAICVKSKKFSFTDLGSVKLIWLFDASALVNKL